MRVLIVNTSEKTGGAAVAAHRLMDALNNHGVKAKMLVRDKESDNISVAKVPGGLCMKWHFLWERWVIFCNNFFSRKHLFDVDIANSGYDITRTREFREADIIHLHWTNQGFLSLKGLEKYSVLANPWYGRCTTCGHAHPSVIMLMGATIFMPPAVTAVSCVSPRLTTCHTRCTYRNNAL